jgi:hypothetical protein
LIRIKYSCFSYCSLKSISIPRNVEILGKSCFCASRLELITFGKSKTNIWITDQEKSSLPGPMNRVSRWIHMFNSEIDWVSSILFCYWQFSVPRKIDRTPDTFRCPANSGLWHDFHYLCFVSSLDISTALHQMSKSESNQRSKYIIFNYEYLKFKN